jgi:copper transport protein
VVAAVVIAAAFSREVVNRRFRDAPGDEPRAPTPEPVLVGADGAPRPGAGAAGGSAPGGGVSPPDDDDEITDDGVTDESEARHLRRSVAFEVVFAVVVLAITAVLVNTAPARTEEAEPVSLTMRSEEVFADVTIAPAVAGPNDIHVTLLPTGAESVVGATMQLTRPGGELAAFDVPLRSLGPGHYYAPLYNIPFPGDWRMIVRVQLGTTNEAVLTDDFSLR